MSSREQTMSAAVAFPRWLRVVLLVVATAILCSCRHPQGTWQTAANDPFQQRTGNAAAAATNPALAATQGVAATAPPTSPIVLASAATNLRSVPAVDQSVSLAAPTGDMTSATSERFAHAGPIHFASPAGDCWCPACTGREYKLPPSDEVLCDGGDDGLQAVVVQDGTVAGLEIEDTVAHYKTQDGQTIILPTNEVCIYAPRFGSVRQIRGASVNKGRRGPEGLARNVHLVGADGSRETSTTLQNLQPLAGISDRPPSLLRGRQQGGGLENDQGISRASSSESAFTNLQAIRFVLIDNRQQPLVVGGMINAIQWTHDLGLQVAIGHKKAQVVEGDRQAALLYRVEESPEPRLRVVKIADRASAHPGDTVHFALKYENVGNRPISELTLIDNLTTRLEYVEGSQVSDRPADFTSEMNEGGSLILRWALPQPVEPGQTGLIQFACRVR